MRHNIATLAQAFVEDEEMEGSGSANGNFHWQQETLKSYATKVAIRENTKTVLVSQERWSSSMTSRHINAVTASLEEAGYEKTGETSRETVRFGRMDHIVSFDVWAKVEDRPA